MSELVSQEHIQKALEEYGVEIAVGDVFLVKDHDVKYMTITRLYINDEGHPIVEFNVGHRGDSRYSLRDFKQRYRTRIRVVGDRAKFEQEMLDKAKDLDALDPYGHMETSDEMALVAQTSQSQVEAMQAEMENRMLQVESVQRVVALKAEQVRAIVAKMSGIVSYLSRVVGLFELYLGVHEEIVQIAEGVSAGFSPIYFRQLVLYMDEEVGDPRIKLDYRGVEHFDEWVRIPENLNKILPEEKGVIAIKPSRQDWFYGENPWTLSDERENNRYTYLLCRNGDNVYRIWTSIPFQSKLFPSPETLQHTREQARRSFTSNVEKTTRAYQKQVLIMQGIIDRTPIFQPIKHMVKLPDPDTYGEVVRLIWDAEPSLTDGHASYNDWKDEINSHIRRGTRVLIAYNQQMRYANRDDNHHRFTIYYSENFRAPPWPEKGVYKIEEVKPVKDHWTTEEALIIRYNPLDTIYTYTWTYVEPHVRKNRVGFKLRKSDVFLLNYDLVTLEDIEYFINSRTDRRNYIHMIRILWDIRDGLLEEAKNERALVALIAEQMKVKEELVWETVDWWKHKNIWQRPVMEDDAKALRMIKRRVQRMSQDGE